MATIAPGSQADRAELLVRNLAVSVTNLCDPARFVELATLHADALRPLLAAASDALDALANVRTITNGEDRMAAHVADVDRLLGELRIEPTEDGAA